MTQEYQHDAAILPEVSEANGEFGRRIDERDRRKTGGSAQGDLLSGRRRQTLAATQHRSNSARGQDSPLLDLAGGAPQILAHVRMSDLRECPGPLPHRPTGQLGDTEL